MALGLIRSQERPHGGIHEMIPNKDCTIRACPICDSDRSLSFGTIRASDVVRVNVTYREDALSRLAVDPECNWPIVECHVCRMLYVQWLPPNHFLTTLYDDVIDQRKAACLSLSPSWIAFQLSAAVNVLKALPWDATSPIHHRLLDFGCGYGSLVEAINSDYVSCIGFETSAIRLERHRLRNLQTFGDWDEIVRLGEYSAVFACEVLEHVSSPKDVLATLRSVLKPNGIIAITVPDFSRSRMKEQLRKASDGHRFTSELNPWEHLNYFSARHLRQLLADCGFRELPLPVDVGVRPGLSGLRRFGNCAKSMLRLIQYGGGYLPESTQMLAQVHD